MADAGKEQTPTGHDAPLTADVRGTLERIAGA